MRLFLGRVIFSAIELVRKGIHWRVGNGKNIHVWVDNWIPRIPYMRPIMPDIMELGSFPVSMLISHSNGTWDEQVVRSIFWNENIEDIFQIPLPSINGEDVRVWHYSKKWFLFSSNNVLSCSGYEMGS